MLLDSISQLLAPQNILLMVLGVVWGMVFGAIPGLTATLAIVVLIPITYGMGASLGMTMLISIYVGAISGGLVSAILIGMPGTPSSITTVFDGFPMAKKGLARKALGVGIFSNFIGCFLSWVCLIFLTPIIAGFALRFSSLDYVAVMIFGLTAVISLSGSSLLKGLIMAAFGLLIATIGTDPTYGMYRNTFGLKMLRGGVGATPAMIGLFVVSQVFLEVKNISEKFLTPKAEKVSPFLTVKEFVSNIPNFIRSSAIGILIGILPGIGGALSNFVAYDQAKKASKHPEAFGQGSIEGLIASETANNASIGGALIPMISIGIPGDAATAVLLGGLMLHGLQPGPLLIREYPEVIYGIYAAMLLSTILMLFIMMGGIRIFPTLLRIKKSYLLPFVLAIGLVGCYNLRYSINDVWIAVIFGIIGYFLKQHDYPFTPIVISLILGSLLENNLRLGLLVSGGSLLPLVTSPVSLIFMILTVSSLVIYAVMRFRKAGGKN